jgi:predicted nucleic acid-binding protein
VDETRSRLDRFTSLFVPLRDERGILEQWERLVTLHAVQGKSTHDARLVAAMQRHGLTHLLTFNLTDFRRYSGVDLLDPQDFALK